MADSTSERSHPQFVIFAGPNGDGKSTSAPAILPDETIFINADEIAKGLPEEPGQNKDIRAGRYLLQQMERLETVRSNFAIETTLASRSLAPHAKRLQEIGYRFHLLYFWVASPEVSIARVAERVRRGGHNIPEAVVRRRYAASLHNLFELYLPLADSWEIWDNTGASGVYRIADGGKHRITSVYSPLVWKHLRGTDD